MSSLGTLSFQSNWTIGNSGSRPHDDCHLLHGCRHRHPPSRHHSTKQQQLLLWPVHSSLEFAGTSMSPLPNALHELTLPTSQQFLALGYAPPLICFKSSSSKIIDLLAGGQDSTTTAATATTTTAVESKTVFALRDSSSGSDGSHLLRSQSSFLSSSPGQNIWRSRELSSSTFSTTIAGDTEVRGSDRVRVSRSSQENSQQDKEDSDGEEYGGVGARPASVNWDNSNAENVPRRRFKKRGPSYSPQDAEESPSSGSFFQGTRNREPSPSYRQGGGEWDYESSSQSSSRENRGGPQSSSWAWWFPKRKDESYDYDGDGADDDEEEDEENEEPNWSSWLKLDLKDTFTLLRWGLPAAFILGAAVIPTMLANPLLLLLGFSFFPSAAKVVNPLTKQFFRSVGNPFEGSSSTTRKKRKGTRPGRGWSRPEAPYREQRSTPRYRYGDGDGDSDGYRYGSPPPPSPREASRSYDIDGVAYRDQQQRSTQTYMDDGSPLRDDGEGRSTRYDFDVSGQDVSLDTNRPQLGGWDDLVDDRSRAKASGQLPLGKRQPMSAQMVAIRDQPLYIRIILALFPFLRAWGGLL